jgi:hypothetical protein
MSNISRLSIRKDSVGNKFDPYGLRIDHSQGPVTRYGGRFAAVRSSHQERRPHLRQATQVAAFKGNAGEPNPVPGFRDTPLGRR